MNKRNTRSFLFGILFTTSIIAVYYYMFFEDSTVQKEETLTVESAKEFLQESNYIVLTELEYEEAIDNAVFEAIQSLLNDNNKQVTSTNETPEKSNISQYTLEVRNGMNATYISNLLLENKIVTEEDDFHTFLTLNGYSKKIRIGKYELDSSMSLEEIAKLITTR